LDATLLATWFPGAAFHLDGIERHLERSLPKRGRVLDLGCGRNTDLARFRSADVEVWGTDPFRHPEVEHASWFRRTPANGRLPFPPDTFDLIHARWVLEHVDQPGRFLAEIHRVLRPGGTFLAHTIHAGHYVTWIRRAFDLLPHRMVAGIVRRLYGRAEVDTHPTRYRLNSERIIRREAGRVGLHLDLVEGYPDPGYFAFIPALGRSAIVLDGLIESLGARRSRTGLSAGRVYFTAVLRKAETTTSVMTFGRSWRAA
jgi:SAM-dependent methyltransferase